MFAVFRSHKFPFHETCSFTLLNMYIFFTRKPLQFCFHNVMLPFQDSNSFVSCVLFQAVVFYFVIHHVVQSVFNSIIQGFQFRSPQGVF